MRLTIPSSAELTTTAPNDRRLAYGFIALALTAGCSSPSEQSPDKSEVEQSRGPNIVVYQDDNFTQPIGKVGGFIIICADYKDPSHRTSMKPENVDRYLIEEESPADGSPLTGFVDPNAQPLMISGGFSPDCDNLTQTPR